MRSVSLNQFLLLRKCSCWWGYVWIFSVPEIFVLISSLIYAITVQIQIIPVFQLSGITNFFSTARCTEAINQSVIRKPLSTNICIFDFSVTPLTRLGIIFNYSTADFFHERKKSMLAIGLIDAFFGCCSLIKLRASVIF